MAWQNMTGVEPKYQIPNSRTKGFVRNGVLILPNCVIVISRFKLAQFLYKLEKQGWSQNFMPTQTNKQIYILEKVGTCYISVF